MPRKLSYVPGSQVALPAAKRRRPRQWKRQSTSDIMSPFFFDVIKPYMKKSRFVHTWIKMSMVNKAFHGAVSNDLVLWRSFFFDVCAYRPIQLWGFNRNCLTYYTKSAEYVRRFNLGDHTPARLARTTDLAPVAFYKKAVQYFVLDTCGMCGNKKNHINKIWPLGMSLCRPCMHSNMISQRVLWEDYGLSLSSKAPTFAKTPALLELDQHAQSVLAWFPQRVWFVKTFTTRHARQVVLCYCIFFCVFFCVFLYILVFSSIFKYIQSIFEV